MSEPAGAVPPAEGEPDTAETNIFHYLFCNIPIYARKIARRLGPGLYQIETITADNLIEMHHLNTGEAEAGFYSLEEVLRLLWQFEQEKYDDIHNGANETKMAKGTDNHFLDHLGAAGLDLRDLQET